VGVGGELRVLRFEGGEVGDLAGDVESAGGGGVAAEMEAAQGQGRGGLGQECQEAGERLQGDVLELDGNDGLGELGVEDVLLRLHGGGGEGALAGGVFQPGEEGEIGRLGGEPFLEGGEAGVEGAILVGEASELSRGGLLFGQDAAEGVQAVEGRAEDEGVKGPEGEGGQRGDEQAAFAAGESHGWVSETRVMETVKRTVLASGCFWGFWISTRRKPGTRARRVRHW